jgi:two-component system, chemotaxis family, chemotaxis protein CheY
MVPPALERLKTKSFALVISNWHMTPMSGLKLLQQIRRDADLKNVRFVLVTADGSFQNSAAVQRLGVDGSLIKPFSSDTLTKTIEQALAPSQQ